MPNNIEFGILHLHGENKNAGTVIQMTGLASDNNTFWVVTHERPVLAGGIRVCDYCCKVVLRYAQQSVSTGEVKVFRDEIRNMSSNQLDIDSGSFEFSMWSPLAKRRSLTKEDLTLPQQRLCRDIHFIFVVVLFVLLLPFLSHQNR